MTFEEFKTRAKQLSLLPEKVRYFIGAIVTTGDFQVNPLSVYPSCRARGVKFNSMPSLAEAEEYIRQTKLLSCSQNVPNNKALLIGFC